MEHQKEGGWVFQDFHDVVELGEGRAQARQKLVNLIIRLKNKHLDDGHNKDTGDFEAEVVEMLNLWCGLDVSS